jgi:hypothetical protein
MGYKPFTSMKRITKMSFEIFKDKNDYNEKNILGFISFAVMVVYSIIDLATGLLDIPLALHEYIYQSFIWITLGSFGIGGLEKFSGTEKAKVDNRNTNVEP